MHRARSDDAPVTVVDPSGATLKIPAWMLSPQASRPALSAEATISPRALLELEELLRPLLESAAHEE